MMTGSSFPQVYTEIATSRLLEAFEQGPSRMRRAVDGLGREELQSQPLPEKWSVQQIVCHVADSELMGAARIRQTLTQSDRRLAEYDQDVWADGLSYQDRTEDDIELAMSLLSALRASTVPLFRQAELSDWKLTGLHAEHGPVTLRNLLELYADHTERHIAQILERRRLLGCPLELPLLLPERLY